MQFLFPSFLWALLALAVPIIIHLFHFRRFKKVYFTNVRFLKELKEETSARSKIKNLLVLLARLLALAALVFAFAQPFIPQDVAVDTKRKVASIFIDNSFSMEALSEDVSIFNRAKQNATEIVQAFGEEDRIQILTHDFEGRHQRLLDKEQALTYIEEIAITPNVRPLSKILDRQEQLLSGEVDATTSIYMISDFQKSIIDDFELADTSINLFALPVQSVQEQNVSIDTAYFDAPVQTINEANRLIVKVHNHGSETLENIRLSIQMDGQEKPIGTITIPGNGTVTDTVNISVLKTGWQLAKLKVTDYPIQFDDEYFIAFEVSKEVNVLVINNNQSNRYLQAALEGLRLFKTTVVNAQSIDYAQFGNFDLIVVNELQNISGGLSSSLQSYIDGGGNALIFPSATANVTTYNSLMDAVGANRYGTFEKKERTVSQINKNAFIFKDVYLSSRNALKLPVSQSNFTFQRSASSREEKLLTYRDGGVMLSQYRLGGNLFVSAVPVDEKYSDLSSSGEIFVPMLYKMAISKGTTAPIGRIIGRDEVLITNNKIASQGDELIYKIKGSEGEFIPEQKSIGNKVILTINKQITKSGFYHLVLKDNTPLESYAYNYDRRESDLSYYNTDEIAELGGADLNILEVNNNTNLTAMIGERNQGIVLWKWCLILVLIFLALEALILRFWKS